MDKTRRGSTGTFLLPPFDFISADRPPPLSSTKRTRPWPSTCILIYFVCQSKRRHYKPQHCGREERAGRPGRQRTRAEVEEDGWKDGWRKKLHRGGHLITASDVNSNRFEDEAACRCEGRFPPPRLEKKTAVQKGGKEEAWEDRGFQRHCDPLWFNQQQNCLTNTHRRPPRILLSICHKWAYIIP